MKDDNIKDLKNLSKTCRRSGILPIFLGVLVAFAGVVNVDSYVLSVGLMIFIVGYAFVKIAEKIDKNIG